MYRLNSHTQHNHRIVHAGIESWNKVIQQILNLLLLLLLFKQKYDKPSFLFMNRIIYVETVRRFELNLFKN